MNKGVVGDQFGHCGVQLLELGGERVVGYPVQQVVKVHHFSVKVDVEIQLTVLLDKIGLT